MFYFLIKKNWIMWGTCCTFFPFPEIFSVNILVENTAAIIWEKTFESPIEWKEKEHGPCVLSPGTYVKPALSWPIPTQNNVSADHSYLDILLNIPQGIRITSS